MERNNFVQLTGNLGADYQIIDLKNGRKMYRIALAVSSAYYDGAGVPVKKTNWFNCLLFVKDIDTILPSLTKGARVQINGEININQYSDKDNVSRFSTEIKVYKIIVL